MRRTHAPLAYVAAAIGLVITGIGLWALIAPHSFYDGLATYPPYNEHLLHDLGAFQLGIGVTVLAALRWSDARAVALLGFLVAGGVHAVNHGTDLHLGGHGSDRWLLGILALLALVALVLQRRTHRTADARGRQS